MTLDILRSQQLTHHFKLHEALDSSTAERLGIDNVPTAEQLENIKATALGMEEVRVVLGHSIHIDSWLRVEALEKVLAKSDYLSWCKRHNHDANDASWDLYFARKKHPKGFAVDFICPGFGTPEEIVAAIQKAGIKYDQLIMEGSWVHISFAIPMRNQKMVATFKNGEPTYTIVG